MTPAREHGPGRLLAFSDGVVAIAATLLVLPLLDVAPERTVDDIGAVLRENQSRFLAFGLSFVVIYRFWLVHHRVFGLAADVTSPLVWLNGLWLLSIVFLPFPTQLIGAQSSEDRVAWGLYTGTLFVTAASSAAILWLIRRHRAGEREDGSEIRLPILAGALAVAFVLAITVPGAGPWALLLLIPAAGAQRYLAGGRRRTRR